jgi:hypothetical protein
MSCEEVSGEKSLVQGTVERAPPRLPCRYSYRHSSKIVGKDADVAT